MNRVITQIGQSIYEWFFTKPAQDNMVALGKLAGAVFGTSPIANGLTCTPTAPASLQVTIGAGEIYALAPLEATAYGTLPADTTHQIIKQGISLDPVLVSCAPPPTGGQAINYLIQVQYQDLDVSLDPTTGSAAPVVLQFYNSSNPSQPWQGPNNNGQTSNTFRNGVVAVQAKAGIAATTGSQVTPAPDAGWTGLSVVTVANGQTTITAGNITPYAGAPILSETLPQKISQATADGRYAAFANLLGASSIPPISVATTLTASAAGRHHVFSAGVPATLPAASSLTAGQAISFHSLVSGASIVRAGTDVITTGNGTPTSISMNAGDTLTLMSNGSSGWYPVDGSMQLQFAAVMRSVTSLGVGAGYRQFPAYPGDPTPLLVQWGFTTSPTVANTESTTTLPTSFPNEFSGLLLTDFATLSNVGVIWTWSAKTLGNFKAYWGAGSVAPGSTNARQAAYIAIGR